VQGIGNYLADEIRTGAIATDHAAFVQAEQHVQSRMEKLLNIKGRTDLCKDPPSI
jgi:succinate dehydrogenase / fumarate reductase flavoprotein subunit